VLQNIISNALKFSRKEVNPVVAIRSDIINHCAFDGLPAVNGGYCRITITDNGIGFDNQYAEKIFTIFQRLHPREKYDGTGIGLAITKKIVERHNGLVAATGKEGEGTQFVLVLPLRRHVADLS
jgi:two-component system CheB/CheR fusion protein